MSKSIDDISDGLEIMSIGQLYTGPWEKKYWSSSRGKDRYPYPIGFKAVRTQNGITYRMEINEGVKGPLFMISSTDGLSCSGQTPDIAWESFQKRSCSRVKFFRGKRFSCKIDGMEFFGFKNAFVQRLLRELMANVGGTAEQNLIPSAFCTEASDTRDPIQLTGLCLNHDLQSSLPKPNVTRKRSRKEKIIKTTSKSVPDLKRVHAQNRERDADASSCRLTCQVDYNDRYCSTIPAPKEENEFRENARALLSSENLDPVIEDEELLASVEDDLQLNSCDVSGHHKVDGHFPQEQSKPVNSGNSTTSGENGNLLKEKEPISQRNLHNLSQIDRSKVSVEHHFKCSITEDEGGRRVCPETIHETELCAPDSLDHPPDYSSTSFCHRTVKEVPTSDSGELKDVISTDTAIPEVLAADSESLREDEMGTSNSNGSSEKGDLDSVGQEIAKSMMTVLLPRALPLLKTFSRKKRKNAKPSIMSTHITMSENDKIDKVASPVRELKENPECDKNNKAQNSVRDHEADGHIQSIIPDSFDDYESEIANAKLCLLPDTAIADQTCACSESCKSEMILDTEAEKSIYHLETTDSKPIIDCKTELVLNQEPHVGNDLDVKASLGFEFPSKMDTFGNMGDNSSHVEKQPADDDAKTFPDYSEDIRDPTSFLDQDLADFDMPTSYSLIQKVSCSDDVAQKKEVKDSFKVNNVNLKHNSKMQDILKLVGCYVHPMPISAILLSTVGDDIYVCVLCGSLVQEDKILFVYIVPITGEKIGCPSFVGHTSVILPMAKDASCGNIVVDSSGLQFTPDGKSLVLLNSIKVPCCREGNIRCPCPSCTSDCYEKNAVKIVHVQNGFVSVVNKLKTAQSICCILVCEPNHLVAAEESGKLYLWVMDLIWSAQMEVCHLPVPDNMPPLVQLKRIPNFPALIIGHDGFGEFNLWDIQKRILVSNFSAPCTPISKCVPISLFRWERKGTVPTDHNQEELINEVLHATKMCFSRGDTKLSQPIGSEDLAIWLLISTVPYPEFQQGYQSVDWQTNSVGSWRLALLVKNMVVMGSPLDMRAAATGASVGHGVIGRSDGLVYMWELSTGIKVGNVHQFKGSGVSCIATDSSTSGALAIASHGGELLVYMHQ